MTRPSILCALLLATACGHSAHSTDFEGTPATVGAASLEVPLDWKPTLADATTRQVWVPANNPGKESIAVRVVDRQATATIDDLEDAVDAEAAMADATISEQHRVTTEEGIQGIWIDLSFTPGSIDASYARTQLTLVTERHVINIFYTALEPDRTHKAIALALATIREEG